MLTRAIPELEVPATVPGAKKLRFERRYRELTRLSDGTKVEVRLLKPSDKEGLRKGLDRLSPNSRYLRFFAPKSHLSDTELRRLTEIDQWDHFALVAGAVRGDVYEGMGVARFVRLADAPDSAEAALAVVDEFQRRGLGSLLLERLSVAAQERGIRWFVSDILAENEPILELLWNLSPDFRIESLGDGVLRAVVAVPDADPRKSPRRVPPTKQSPRFWHTWQRKVYRFCTGSWA